jgi:hypothetical protein
VNNLFAISWLYFLEYLLVESQNLYRIFLLILVQISPDNLPVFQRPSAKELMRHPFIKKAKKNAYLFDLIDRYRKWKINRGDESESDSGGESGGETGGDDSDTDWNMTVKGLPANAYIEPSSPQQQPQPPPSYESVGYSAPVNSISDKERGSCLPQQILSADKKLVFPPLATDRKRTLKGTVPRDFRLQVFVVNKFSPKPPSTVRYTVRAASNCFQNSQRYSQLKLHHQCR